LSLGVETSRNPIFKVSVLVLRISDCINEDTEAFSLRPPTLSDNYVFSYIITWIDCAN